jgi:hypothetical protein
MLSHSMERTGPPTEESPSNEERRRQVERVLASVTFSSAPGLKSLLEFIVSLAGEGRSDEISEYAIATQLFGRPPSFDPASDTIVRTQAYRLRLKLKEYYEQEGKDDGIGIDVPKGHYVPLFQFRRHNVLNDPVPPIEVPVQPEPASAAPTAVRDKLWMHITGVILLAVVMFIGGAAVGSHWLGTRQSALPAKSTQGIEAQFWSGFFNANRHVIVAFWDFNYIVSMGNNVLLPTQGRPLVERFIPADPKAAANPQLAAMAGRLYFENGFAPLGDMLGVQRLSILFTNLGATAAVIRAHQLTLEELRDNDVVFLGSFDDRGNLLWLPEHWPWRFERRNESDLWDTHIIDKEAPAGANSRFGLKLNQEHVLQTEYSLVSVIPGVNPARRVVVLSGLTTSGTQGGAEFLTSEAGLRDLLAAIGTRQNGRLEFPRFFQCVVRVEVAHGLDVISTKYVTGAAFHPK